MRDEWWLMLVNVLGIAASAIWVPHATNWCQLAGRDGHKESALALVLHHLDSDGNQTYAAYELCTEIFSEQRGSVKNQIARNVE